MYLSKATRLVRTTVGGQIGWNLHTLAKQQVSEIF